MFMLTTPDTLHSLPAGASLWISRDKQLLAAYVKQANGLWDPFHRLGEFDTTGFYPREAQVDNPHRPLQSWELVSAVENASATIEQVR